MYVTMITKDEKVMNLGRGETWGVLDWEERMVMYGVDEIFMFDILKKSKKNIVQFSSVKASLMIRVLYGLYF